MHSLQDMRSARGHLGKGNTRPKRIHLLSEKPEPIKNYDETKLKVISSLCLNINLAGIISL